MKKITSGILGLVAIITIVSSAAYAYFTSQVTITGMVLGTATPVLKISLLDNDVPAGGWQTTLALPSNAIDPLMPGNDDWGEFAVKNVSLADTNDPLKFRLTGKLIGAEGDWGILSNAIESVVYLKEDETKTTGWRTLAYWNTNDVPLPGGELSMGDVEKYIVRYRLAGNPGNGVAGKKITNVQFVITGTQI